MKDVPLRIAVVDDDPQALALVKDTLIQLGYKINLYKNGENFLEEYQTKQVDLVILDVMMPGVDGFEACRKVKEDDSFLPVILLTALDDRESKIKGIKAGCDEFLTKPISPVELTVRVANLIKLAELGRNAGKRKEIAQRLCKISHDENKNKLRLLLVEDSPQDQLLIETFLNEDGYKIDRVEQGVLALEMLENNDYDLVLLDYFLPDMTGLEVLEKIQNDILPVMMITANDDSLAKVKSIETGVNDYMVKPVNPLELKAKVKHLLENSQKRKKLLGEYSQAMEKAIKDNMTGLYNNYYLKEFLKDEMGYAQKRKRALSLLMLDIDDFKEYNDTNGHLHGDEALIKVAEIITDNIRGSDLASRYGGEEFAVVLPSTSFKDGLQVAEKIRRGIEDYIFKGEEKLSTGNLTISIGVAEFEKGLSLEEFLQRADDGLYLAKKQGKNQARTIQ